MKKKLWMLALALIVAIVGSALLVNSVTATEADFPQIVVEKDTSPSEDGEPKANFFVPEGPGGQTLAGSCSGSCDSRVCICSGDPQCCVAGCGICFDIVNQL